MRLLAGVFEDCVILLPMLLPGTLPMLALVLRLDLVLPCWESTMWWGAEGYMYWLERDDGMTTGSEGG